MFESSHTTNPDDISTRHPPKLTKMNSPQVTHIIHHMFDGITHNTHNTNGAIGRMRKDFPGGPTADQIGGQVSPHGMGDNNMCNGGPGSGQHYPPQIMPHNAGGPQLTDMNCLPPVVGGGVGVGGMMGAMDGHYGNSFQLSANVQAEAAEMNEEDRRRRYGLGSSGDGRMPPMGSFESNMVPKMGPFRHEPQGATKSSAEEDEEDEDDYDEEFEDVRTMEDRQAGKPVPTRRKMQFNCFQCPKSYRSRKSLVAHHKKHPGFCADCGVKRGFALDEIIAHNTQHHIAQYPFVCEECGESFRRNQQFKNHHSAVHGGREQWHTCPECSESFPTLAVYRKHLADKNHTDNPAICDICGDRFNGLPLLKKHVLKMHKQDAKKYGCKYCEKSFTLKSNLERHMRMHTEVQKGFICEKCGTEYFSSQALKDHCNQAHVEMKPFECNFCKKRFSHQRSLRKHAQSHSEERPFVCDICVQAFKHKTHLVRHKQSVHHEQPAKKKAKRMQENSKGELIPVAEPKAPTAKASSSKTKQSVAPAAVAEGAKHFQPYPDNNMFFNPADQQHHPALPPNTSVPMQQQQHQQHQQLHHNNMHGYGQQPPPGRPPPPHPHMHHPHLQHPHQPGIHQSIPPNGPHPSHHHPLQHPLHPSHHPHPHENPTMHPHHLHPQYHPQHPHHPHMQPQPHQMQQQQQPPHHLQQSPHMAPTHQPPSHRQMPNNMAYAPAINNLDRFGIPSNNINNNNNHHSNNANMFQQQHFQSNAVLPPNHDHYQSSFAFKTEPQQPPTQPQPHQQQHNLHPAVPSAHSPHIKLESYTNADPLSRPGSATSYAASPFDQQQVTNSWTSAGGGSVAAGGGATTPTTGGAGGGSTPGPGGPNKMFSLVEGNSGEYMKVEMPPPFMKQELNDVELMQYPNLWDSTDATGSNSQQQQQHTLNYNIESTSTNSYNNIGSILSNLELLGNNASYDAASFDMITNNFEQAQQATKQAPQQQAPAALTSPHPQQQHQPPNVVQPAPPPQQQQQQHVQMHQMHLQRQQLGHHPNHLPPLSQPNKPNPMMNPADPGMAAYFNNQPGVQSPSGGYAGGAPPQQQQQQPLPHDTNNSAASVGGYPNHTITDISNTYLTDNQRTNLQQHVDYNHLQPTTSVAMASPSTNNGNFYAVGGPMAGGGGGIGVQQQGSTVPKLGGSGAPPDVGGMPSSMTDYLHTPM